MIDLLQIVSCARSLRPHTKRGYTNVIRQWLDFAGENPTAWTAANMQAFYDSLLARGVAVQTANNMINGGLTYAFGRAAALHGVPDVTQAVDTAKVTEAPAQQRALTGPQARRLLAACQGATVADRRDWSLVLLGLFTGMRRMSLIDVDTSRVHGENPVMLNVRLKGGIRYDVPLDARAWRETEQLRMLQPTVGPLFCSVRPEGPTIKPLTEDGVYRILRRRAATANLPAFHPHLFRHTFSTWCRSAKIEDYLIEVVTGHKSNRGLVDRVYTDRAALAAEVAQRCYDAVQARLVGTGE